MLNRTEQWLTQAGGLADRLKTARLRANLTGATLAETNGWPTSKISKIENGRQMPTNDDVLAWLAACSSEAESEDLLTLLAQLQARHQDWRRRARNGQVALQSEYNDLLRTTRVLRDFTTVFIPSMLQTAEYAGYPLAETAALHGTSEGEVDAAVAIRLQRQQHLYDPTKRFEFLLAEPVLRWLICPPEVMLGQLDRLLTVVTGLPNLTLGVLPMGTRLAISPQNAFSILDDTVLVETFIGETVHSGDQATSYAHVMDRLWEHAAVGEHARRLIVAAANALHPDESDQSWR